jgi:poly-gamma-glutamate synthase PgsB/CapB
VARHEHRLCFLLERLGHLIKHIAMDQSNHDIQNLLLSLQLEEKLSPLIRYDMDERIAYEATGCLRVAFDNLNSDIINQIDPKLIQHAYRVASDPYQPIWVQTETLALLLSFGHDSAVRLLTHRLKKPSTLPDDLFFRARALSVLLEYQNNFNSEELGALTYLVLDDPSIFVRQQLCSQLILMPKHLSFSLFEQLSKNDKAPQVRAKSWICLVPILKKLADNVIPHELNSTTNNPEIEFTINLNNNLKNYIRCYLHALSKEIDGIMLRLLMEKSVEILKILSKSFPDEKEHFYNVCHQRLTEIHTTHNETRVRRWAALSREQLWHYHQDAIKTDHLQTFTTLSFEKVKKAPLNNMPEQQLGRHLSALNMHGIGLDISYKKRSLTIRGGYTLGFRLWRFIHEWRHPSTDKRQNYNHTLGRIFHGNIQIPPQKLAESSETKVPGEPVLIEQEQGWRPYLPLVDQVLSSLDQGWPTQPIRLYTSEGITFIKPPKNPLKRIWAKLYISFHFKMFSELRNWHEEDDIPAKTYLQKFEKLGFNFSINTYKEHDTPLPIDKRIAQFFPSFLPFYSFSELYRELQNYFYSVYQNTLEQLSIFLLTITAVFFGHHFWINREFRKARNSIPFVMGGWGTRGKSGTERLKAALFNANGLSIISKSTGCEAQFLYAPLNRPLKELFLFRPYDKASIWEQLHLTRLAAKLKVNILLWECMGLTPRYINILQQQWMRDDLSTITNCYPDHEDIQGPSGIDIPKVMMRFVPKNSTLITSEDTMSPLLEIAARENNSQLHQIKWYEGVFLAPDILSRFPYEEHPTNIALVLKMATVLGIPQDMALKSMADKVVPDLGVLKVYPECSLQNRKFIFINGMSANERLAALNNWHRLALDKITPQKHPEIWLTTVVNNRADRISRSQVFAKMIVNDLSADRHFLIGSNVDGLIKYIEAQWQQKMMGIPFNPTNEVEKESLTSKFISTCQYLRIPMTETDIQSRISSILTSLLIDNSDEISSQWESREKFKSLLLNIKEIDQANLLDFRDQADKELREFENLNNELFNKDTNTVGKKIRDQLWRWFRQHLIVIEDEHISGNDLIKLMLKNTPTGLCNKMIGLQNIKGTGLDFVYRWQNWDNVYKLCQDLNSKKTNLAKSSAKALANISDFGLLDQELVLNTCHAVRETKMAQTEFFQAELNAIELKIKQQLSKINENTNIQKSHKLIDKLINGLEDFLDAGMSIKRRRRTERIYQDISDQRISLDRACVELQRINKEQKGGWLKRRLGNQGVQK